MRILFFSFSVMTMLGFSNFSFGADDQSAAPEKVDLSKIQEKYLGNADNEVQVIQNRKYTKAHKFEVGVLGGIVTADSFLNDYALGGYVAYNFSEYVGIRALYWKDLTSKADSWYQANAINNLYINTNAASSMLGAEFSYSPIYGKLSLLGSAIFYYDMNLYAGAGDRKTQSGSAISPMLGIGQQFFFGQSFELGIDYELMYYKENVLDQDPQSPTYGGIASTRTNFSHVIFLTFGIMI